MSNNPYDYQNRKNIQPISWEDFHSLCKALATAIAHFKPDIILAVGRGGFYPGTLIAHLLQTEIYPIRLSRRVNDVITYKNPQWLVEPPSIIKNKQVVIVDEICSTGETITIIKNKVETIGAKAIKSAVLYAHSKGVAIPDYIGLISDALILNPWDREILKDGNFIVHPEYAKGLAMQGIQTNASLLINTHFIKLAKG